MPQRNPSGLPDHPKIRTQKGWEAVFIASHPFLFCCEPRNSPFIRSAAGRRGEEPSAHRDALHSQDAAGFGCVKRTRILKYYNTFAHYNAHGPMLQAWLDTAH